MYLGQWKKVLKSVSGTMEEGDAASLFKYQSAEHIISSAVRLVPLGQWRKVLQSDFSNATNRPHKRQAHCSCLSPCCVFVVNKLEMPFVSRCQGLRGLQRQRLHQSPIHHQRLEHEQQPDVAPSPCGEKGGGPQVSESHCRNQRDLAPGDPH